MLCVELFDAVLSGMDAGSEIGGCDPWCLIEDNIREALIELYFTPAANLQIMRYRYHFRELCEHLKRYFHRSAKSFSGLHLPPVSIITSICEILSSVEDGISIRGEESYAHMSVFQQRFVMLTLFETAVNAFRNWYRNGGVGRILVELSCKPNDMVEMRIEGPERTIGDMRKGPSGMAAAKLGISMKAKLVRAAGNPCDSDVSYVFRFY